MTQEEMTLLVDLRSRLFCGLICSIYREDDDIFGWRNEKLTGFFSTEYSYEFYFGETPLCVDSVLNIKPYLRPMSSMTEEESLEWFESVVPTMDCDKQLDFYCKYHFDFRGLIPIGLALEAPEGMYK